MFENLKSLYSYLLKLSDWITDENVLLIPEKSFTIELQDDFQMLRNFLSIYLKTIRIQPSYLNFEWRELSSGEKALLNIYSRFYTQNDQYNEENGIILILNHSDLIILIDEGEIYLHPNWQRKFLNLLLKFLSVISNKNIQIILTSHSPFVISDLPKENIIFLDKDQDGNCKVVDIEQQKQTFGANIGMFHITAKVVYTFYFCFININDLKN